MNAYQQRLILEAHTVIVTATQAVETARQILDLTNQDLDYIRNLGRGATSARSKKCVVVYYYAGSPEKEKVVKGHLKNILQKIEKCE